MAVALKGLILVVLLLASAAFYASFLLIPSVILLPFSIRYSRLCFDLLVTGPWFGFVAALLELIYGVKVVIQGDINKRLTKTKPTLIIMNHRCRFDWLFQWCFLTRLGTLPKQKIMLKRALASLPVFGWGMDFGMFIFVHRKWSEDQKAITDMLNFYSESAFPVQLLIFPEGTDLSPSNKMKDREFAMKQNLPMNEYVMHPRTTGFVHCLKTLRQNGEVDICDITVGYVGKITQGEKEMLQGDLPSEIHFHVKHFPYSTISSLNDEELGVWLKNVWKDKEERLREFYKNQSFPQGPALTDDWTIRLTLWGYMAFAMLTSFLFLYLLPWSLIAVMSLLVVSFVVHRFVGGWSKVILKLWDLRKRKTMIN